VSGSEYTTTHCSYNRGANNHHHPPALSTYVTSQTDARKYEAAGACIGHVRRHCHSWPDMREFSELILINFRLKLQPRLVLESDSATGVVGDIVNRHGAVY